MGLFIERDTKPVQLLMLEYNTADQTIIGAFRLTDEELAEAKIKFEVDLNWPDVSKVVDDISCDKHEELVLSRVEWFRARFEWPGHCPKWVDDEDIKMTLFAWWLQKHGHEALEVKRNAYTGIPVPQQLEDVRGGS